MPPIILLPMFVVAWVLLCPEAGIRLLLQVKRWLRYKGAQVDANADYQEAHTWFKNNKHRLPREQAKLLKQTLEGDTERFLALLTEEREAERQQIPDDPMEQFFG